MNENSRTEKTKHSLREALFTLVEVQSYEEITVQDISEEARVSRASFYRHYKHKGDLLASCCEQRMNELKATYVFPLEIQPEKTGLTSLEIATTHFSFVAQNRSFFRAALSSPAVDMQVYQLMRRTMRGVVILVANNSGIVADLPVPPEIALSVVAGGLMELTQWWVASDRHYPPAMVAEVFMRMVETGLFGLSGRESSPYDVTARPFEAGKFLD